jgi:DnaJ-class molecular chaperone
MGNKMINEAYQILKDFEKEHGRFSSNHLDAYPEIMQALVDTENEIKKFDGKKVKLTYKATSDWFSHQGEKTGKIEVDDKGHVRFFEGRKRSKFQYLDSGFFEGFYATIIPLTIEEIK